MGMFHGKDIIDDMTWYDHNHSGWWFWHNWDHANGMDHNKYPLVMTNIAMV